MHFCQFFPSFSKILVMIFVFCLLFLISLVTCVRNGASLNQQKNSFKEEDTSFVDNSQPTSSLNKTEIVLLVLMSSQDELPVRFEALKPAVELATEYVNARYSEFKIRVVARQDSATCEANAVAGMAAEEYYLRQVNGIIGPICTRALDPVGRLAAHWGIPLITAGGIGIEFANKSLFKSLTRIAFSLDRVGDFFLKIIQDYDWHHFSLLVDESEPANVLVKTAFEKVLKEANGKNGYNIFLDVQEFSKAKEVSGSDTINYEKLLLTAKRSSRVFIFLCNGEISRNFLVKAYDLGMSNGEYVFFGVELIKSGGEANDFSWYKAGDKSNRKAKLAYESFFSLAVRVPTSPEYNLFVAKVVERATSGNSAGGEHSSETSAVINSVNVNPLLAAFYDAIVIYAWAHNKSLYFNEALKYNEKIRKFLWNNVFSDGLSGDLFINENGDRELDYTLSDFSPETGMMQPVFTYYGRRRQVEKMPGVVIHWPNNKNSPPDVPFCGFSDEARHCIDEELLPIWAIVLLSLLVAGGLSAVAAVYILQKLRSESDLNSNWWNINYNEIIFPTRAGGNKSSLSQLTTSDNYDLGGSTVRTKSALTTSRTVSQASLGLQSLVSAAGLFDSVLVGLYRGVKIAYKPLVVKRLNMNRKMLIEFRQMRDIQHENLCRFIGVCLDENNTALVTELMIRGSLRDILDEGKLQIDWTFRYSMISDIVEGMIFLHSSVIEYHGRLKSTNCVVDGRFMVKICDYGTRTLHKQVSREKEINPRAFFWTAPEHLRSPDPMNHGSKAGDVYAFAIILKEIITRLQPYDTASKKEGITLEPQEILDRVKMGIVPPFRPEIVSPDCPNGLIKVVQACWQEDPALRPDFTKVKGAMRKISSGVSSSNFLDNLLARMEQYSANLERIVEEKCAQMVEEKAKAEELLYQILPKTVANELKFGRTVPPELFDSATVFVSDIVQFTVIASMSSPMQVVGLLNDLYSNFDAIVGGYDAYKIETIGDAFLVASGVPSRNGKEHAREIATLAFEMLDTVTQYQIKHLPKTKLRLRIGLHSGPVAAGVVGLKMPKYLVFGETVNTAQKMESSGEPMKIHVSADCKAVLDTFGIFQFSERGEVEIAGNKKLKTYWLETLVEQKAPGLQRNSPRLGRKSFSLAVDKLAQQRKDYYQQFSKMHSLS